jgi:hypothetical protein
MRKTAIAILLAIALPTICIAETYTYANKDGSKGSMTVVVDGATGCVTITTQTDSISCDSGWNSILVHHADNTAGSVADFSRTGNTIKAKGTLKGKPFDRDISIDSNPWFSDFATQLKSLMASGKNKQEFWIINPNEYKAVKMVATLKGQEDFTTPAGTFKANHYIVGIPGVPTAIWSVSVWLRTSDGVNLSYNKESLLASVSK